MGTLNGQLARKQKLLSVNPAYDRLARLRILADRFVEKHLDREVMPSDYKIRITGIRSAADKD